MGELVVIILPPLSGVPSPLFSAKVSLFLDLQLNFLQSLVSKWVVAKVFLTNGLAALALISPYLKYSGLELTKMPCGSLVF